MHDVVDLLEVLARDPRGLDPADPALAGLAPGVARAIAAGDAPALRSSLGVPALACLIVAPDGDEPAPDDQPADGDETPEEREDRAA